MILDPVTREEVDLTEPKNSLVSSAKLYFSFVPMLISRHFTESEKR
jgi:hypothetical protein